MGRGIVEGGKVCRRENCFYVHEIWQVCRGGVVRAPSRMSTTTFDVMEGFFCM
jgi:hypothetical protein